MSNSATVLLGNIVNEPQVRAVNDSQVLNFRMATNHRAFDPITGDWRDVSSLFIDVSCWGKIAANALFTLSKGLPIIAYGYLHTASFTPKDSDRIVSVIRLKAVTVAPDLRYLKGRLSRFTEQRNGVDVLETVGSSAPFGSLGREEYGASSEHLHSVATRGEGFDNESSLTDPKVQSLVA